MNKNELLEELLTKVNSGELTKDEVTNKLSLSKSVQSSHLSTEKEHEKFQVTKVLYILGASVVIVGVILLIGQIWNEIGSFGRVGVTFGLGALFNILGLFLMGQKPEKLIGLVYTVIGGIMIPFGVFILVDEFYAGNQIRIFSFICIFLSYLLFNKTFKHFVLTFFAILNITIAAYLTLFEVKEVLLSGLYDLDKAYNYLTIAIGVSYIILSRVFIKNWNAKLVGPLNFLGITGILGSMFSLVFGSVFWQITFVFALMASFALSINMKSKIILIMSNVFLILHISYISSEYFANSVIGWPLTIVIVGLIFIALGYGSVAINKKFIKN